MYVNSALQDYMKLQFTLTSFKALRNSPPGAMPCFFVKLADNFKRRT